jgi:hypothetical protein
MSAPWLGVHFCSLRSLFGLVRADSTPVRGAGGDYELVIDGLAGGRRSFDNVAFDAYGQLIVVSDDAVPFNNIYSVDVDAKTIRTIGIHTPKYFGTSSSAPAFPFTSYDRITVTSLLLLLLLCDNPKPKREKKTIIVLRK